MVGRAVEDYCRSLGDLVIPHDHQSLDISNPDLVLAAFEKDKPEAVINCAAWTDVDGCEVDHNRAYAANARGPEILANASREVDAVFVTISTDYVFDGEKEGFYTQRDQPKPLNVYGLSKLEGERRAQIACARTIVARTGLVFGSGGDNFLSTIVERARKGEKLKAISDAYGTPTYARDLAARLRELIELDLPGIYHVVNAGNGASFEEFACEAIRVARCEGVEVEGILTDSLNRPAARPRNSRLRCLLSDAISIAPLPDWRHSLRDFVDQQSRGSCASILS